MLWCIFWTSRPGFLSYVHPWLLGGTVWSSTWDRSLNHDWLHVTPGALVHPWELKALHTFEDVPFGHEYFGTSPFVPLKFLLFSLGFCSCTIDSPFLPFL